jgi:hypothetical protein
VGAAAGNAQLAQLAGRAAGEERRDAGVAGERLLQDEALEAAGMAVARERGEQRVAGLLAGF